MKRYPYLIGALFLALALLVAGCGASAPVVREELAREEMPAPMATTVVEKPMPAQPEVPVEKEAEASGVPTENLLEERKIIYQGSIFLIVEDTDQAARDIEKMVQSAGGYVARMNSYRRGDRMYYDITVRVPAGRFENFRTALRKLAVRVENEELSTNDVTDQYYDLEARIKTLKETEAELTELLRKTEERGGDVEDIMKIYEQLSRIRAEIESMQGQLNRLDRLTAYSTLDIHLEPHVLSEPITPEETWSFMEIVHSSVKTLVTILAGLATLAIRFIIVVVPVVLIILTPLAVILWGVNRWLKRR